jgi:hypothetical protein
MKLHAYLIVNRERIFLTFFDSKTIVLQNLSNVDNR